MFKVHEYVICAGSGVCEVKNICSNPFDESKPDEKFYILQPVYSKENTVYIPIKHPKIMMRRLISKEEAHRLIADIPNIGEVNVENDRQREIEYKNIIHKLDCYELIKMIKTLYERSQKRLSEGKKATHTDQKYIKLAEQTLHEELAIVLDMPRDQVGEYILEQVEQVNTNT